MPIWEVSEPCINLWVYDEPLAYQPGIGPRISFKFLYKQRADNDISPNIFNMGTNWACSCLSYVDDEYTYYDEATLVLGHGGQITFTPDGSTIEGYTHTSLERLTDGGGDLIGFVRSYATGAKDYYTNVPVNGVVLPSGDTAAFISARIDRTGRLFQQYNYEEPLLAGSYVFRLLQVVDGDGRTNTLQYEDSNPTLITGVTDPFGREASVQYDDQGLVTNITDPMGLSSSFSYDEQNWITNMTTPYGTTSFEHYEDSWSSAIPRAIRIIDPCEGTNIYMLRQYSGFTYFDNIPIPSVPFPTATFDTNLQYRESFHWGPRQAGGLPADFVSFGEAECLLARMRHWLHGRDFCDYGSLTLGPVMSAEVEPSPDGVVPGQATWYLHEGQCAWYAEGTNSLPWLVVRQLPDSNVWYTAYYRDVWGRSTNITDTYCSAFGTPPNTRSRQFVYDGFNPDLLEVIGPEGEPLAGYAYVNHQVQYATNAVGDVASYTYDSQGRLTNMVTAAGLTNVYVYFPSGPNTNFVQSVIQAQIGCTNSYTYSNDLLYTHTDERGLATTNLYDGLSRVTNSASSLGVVSYLYNKLDLVKVVDRMGFANSFAYDNLRRRIAETNALGYFTLYNYCACGSLESIQDAAGNVTSFTYDNAGRRIQTSFPDGYSISYSYNPIDQVVSTVDSAGYTVTNWFNNQGLLYAVSNALGQAKAMVFDIEDRATNSSDINGVAFSTVYDNVGRVLSRSYPDGGKEQFAYAASGLVGYTNQLGFSTRYGYDPAMRKTAETNANNEATLFSYSPASDLLTLTDGKNQTTTWIYDQYGRLTNKLDNLNDSLVVYTYDADNRLAARWTPAKGTTSYSYDPVGNLTNIAYPATSSVSLAYDPMNRLTNMVDGIGTTRYSYDAAGQFLSENGPWADDTVNYAYENRLRQSLSVLAPNGSAWSQGYTYDAADRLWTVMSPAGTFTYLHTSVVPGSSGSLVANIALPNGMWVTNVYDNMARLSWTDLQNYPSTPPGGFDSWFYGYNTASQRTSVLRFDLSTVSYTYDNIGQLKTGTGRAPTSQPRLQEQFGYTYDAAGNLNWRTNNALVEAFNVNSLNELTTNTHTGTLTVAGTTTTEASSVTVNGVSASRYFDGTFAAAGFTVTNGNNSFTAIASDSYGRHDTNTITVNLPATVIYSYDSNGNLLSDGNRYFAYDDENQLTSVTVSNSWRSEFAYDGKMRRRIRREYTWNATLAAWDPPQEVRYVYDGNLVIQERDGNNLPTVTYTRGNDLSGSLQGAGGIGGLLARSDNHLLAVGDPGAHAYYHADGNGNITCLVNTNQALVARYLYDPYGNTLAQSGTLADANLYRFSSKECHTNSAMYYYEYRFCDPSLQRWVNRDPSGEDGGINLYVYVANDPVDWFDRWGDMPSSPGNGSKLACEKAGGKFQTPAQHDYGGDTGKCVNNCMTARMYEASFAGGAIGGGIMLIKKCGGLGFAIGTVLGGAPYAYCELKCRTYHCYK